MCTCGGVIIMLTGRVVCWHSRPNTFLGVGAYSTLLRKNRQVFTEARSTHWFVQGVTEVVS